MNVHGGAPDGVLDFSVNVPHRAIPKELKELWYEQMNLLDQYPLIDPSELLMAYGGREGIAGNGATELMYLYAQTMKHSKVLIGSPCYTEYERAFHIAGTTVDHVDLFVQKDSGEYLDREGYEQLTLKRIEEAMRKKSYDALVLCNPNNPMGTYYSSEWITQVQVVTKVPYLFIDESFHEFFQEMPLGETLWQHHTEWFALRSLTKSGSMPGVRVGYGIGSPSVLRAMKRGKQPWTMNHFAVTAWAYYLKHGSFLNQTWRTAMQKRRQKMFQLLKDIRGIHPYESDVNFILFTSQMEGLWDQLLQKNIYVRSCADFKFLNDRFYRVAVHDDESNAMLINALRSIHE